MRISDWSSDVCSSDLKLRRITMNTQATETEIQALIETYRQAVMEKNVEKVMALYDDNIVSFDAIQALQFKGKVAYRAHWQACMEMCPGPHKFDFHQVEITSRSEEHTSELQSLKRNSYSVFILKKKKHTNYNKNYN